MSEGDHDPADAQRAETDIRELDERTVQQIAAGEVVERPASVVKELIENSLDADASRVDVAVEAGGTERIVVRDDGVGMTEADARAAVREHTTSKIRDVDDLESGVATLGFRGEALYTIGAVSRTTIRTKPRGGDRGTELRLVGGDLEAVGPTGCPEGTTVEVEDLFFNTPARQKYLKTESTEFSRVNRVVTRYALANPDVAVSLSHDGREVFATTGRGDRQSTVLSVYGREVAEAMIPVEGGTDDGTVTVSGHVSHPETTRSSREYVSTYVNGRYVRSAAVREAVLEAYGNQLAPDRYPFAVLFVDLPGDQVDVNAHPRKMEVRFEEEGAVRDAVHDAVEAALLDHGLVRSSAPRGRSAPDEADVAPERDTNADAPTHEQSKLGADGDAATDAPVESTGDAADAPEDSTTASTRPGMDEVSSATGSDGPSANESTQAGRDPTPTTSDAAASDDRTLDGPPSAGSGTGRSTDGHATDARPNGSTADGTAASTDGESEPATAEAAADERPAMAATSTDARTAGDPSRKFQPATETATLGDAPGGATTEFDRLPPMRVLGQLHDTYVVAETPDGLVLVDQHAADERVNYERLCEQFAGETTTQVLADPVELELTAREAALFDEYRDALAQLGFHAGLVPEEDATDGDGSHDATGGRLVEVTTVPAVLGETLDPELLRDVLSEFVSTDPDERGESTVSATADALLSDLACYPSVTGNTSLREGDVVDLLAALDDCENPYACPHGRPVVIEFGEREIEERFERDYPGHAHRRPE
ncbi:DNA mismatch repair endonuclease MutL [Halomicrococcus gelatinilyticus]|uniref:DNA mismatch repair endonuclease MutL n=1 Tax=Halomicrococcus gelatinilyticus TaxID=1702103 RepID=UPI002E0DCBF1